MTTILEEFNEIEKKVEELKKLTEEEELVAEETYQSPCKTCGGKTPSECICDEAYEDEKERRHVSDYSGNLAPGVTQQELDRF